MKLTPWKRNTPQRSDAWHQESSLARLRDDMDSLFERFFDDPWFGMGRSTPMAGFGAIRTDLAESQDGLTVTMDLPGIKADEVDISVSGNVLTVRGERKEESDRSEKNYHYTERQYGSFERQVQLPPSADADKVDATFKDGVLTIEIAKRPEATPKKIEVKQQP